MKHGGKLAILTILIVGAVLGSFGWLWQVSQGRKALEAWGADSAMVIRYGAKAELSILSADAPGEADARKLRLGGVTVYASRPQDVSAAQDLIHYRRALVDDYAFDWNDPPGASRDDAPAQWTHALKIDDGKATRTLAFDFSRNVVRLVETGQELRLEKITAAKLAGFFKQQ